VFDLQVFYDFSGEEPHQVFEDMTPAQAQQCLGAYWRDIASLGTGLREIRLIRKG